MIGISNKSYLIADEVYTANRYTLYTLNNDLYLLKDNECKFVDSIDMIYATNYDTYIIINKNNIRIVIDYYGNIHIDSKDNSYGYIIDSIVKSLLQTKSLYDEYKENIGTIEMSKMYGIYVASEVTTNIKEIHSMIGKTTQYLVDTKNNKILHSYSCIDIYKYKEVNGYLLYINKPLKLVEFYRNNKYIETVPSTLSKYRLEYKDYTILVGMDEWSEFKVISKVDKDIEYIQFSGDLEIKDNNIFMGLDIDKSLTDRQLKKTKAIRDDYIAKNKINYAYIDCRTWRLVDTDNLGIKKDYVWYKLETKEEQGLGRYIGIGIESGDIVEI